MVPSPVNSRAKIAKSETAGNGMFATEDIAAGEAIFSFRPSIVSLDLTKLDDTCSNCLRRASDIQAADSADANTQLKACTGCHKLRYCSKQCQTEAWSFSHKHECKLIKKFPPRFPVNNILRATMQMMQYGCPVEYSPFKDTKIHSDEIAEGKKTESERWMTLGMFAYGISEYTKIALPAEEIGVYICLCFTNSLTVYTATYDALGMCVDPFVSSANHSCDPNAMSVWDGNKLSFRSLRPIKREEEICITYIDASWPRERRKRELSERYYFDCHCSKCSRGELSKQEAFLRDPPPDEADKFCLIHKRLLLQSEKFFRDEKVNDELQPEDIRPDRAPGLRDPATMFSLIESTTSSIPEDVAKARDPLSLVRCAIRACRDTAMWPEHRQPLPTLNQEEFVLLLSSQAFKKTLKSGFGLYFNAWPVLYPQSFNPQLIAHKWTLAKLCLYMASMQSHKSVRRLQKDNELDFGVIIWGLLLEIQDNVDRSHGKDSAFAGEVKRKVEEVRVDMTRGNPQMVAEAQRKIPEQWSKLRFLVLHDA